MARRSACALPRVYLERMRNGHDPKRSGNLQIVPVQPNFFGEWLSHSGPWPYLQRIPLLFFGPGHVSPRGEVSEAATSADIAPTLASLLGSSFEAPDGRPLRSVVREERSTPDLLVVIVWDSVGINVLETHPDAWPVLRELARQGVWFDRATVGSSPTTTGAVHATIGTGAFPRTHRRVGHRYVSSGRVIESEEVGPADLHSRTLADHWGLEHENRPLTGLVAFKPWHLGLLGHGTFLEGGDPDLAVMLDLTSGRWTLDPPDDAFFRFPGYIDLLPQPRAAIRSLDLEDGRVDGRWLGEHVLEAPGDLVATPAYAEWQTTVLEEMVVREGFGRDGVADILYTNYDQPDLVGHRWSMNSRQMERAIRALDRELGRLVRFLDAQVGTGRWALALTSDHGATPDPEVSGAAVLRPPAMVDVVEQRFSPEEGGPPLIVATAPSELWIDEERLAERGASLENVARFLLGLTVGDVMGEQAGRHADDPLLAAAFPSDWLGEMSCR